jgi:hypothetical protein
MTAKKKRVYKWGMRMLAMMKLDNTDMRMMREAGDYTKASNTQEEAVAVDNNSKAVDNSLLSWAYMIQMRLEKIVAVVVDSSDRSMMARRR